MVAPEVYLQHFRAGVAGSSEGVQGLESVGLARCLRVLEFGV